MTIDTQYLNRDKVRAALLKLAEETGVIATMLDPDAALDTLGALVDYARGAERDEHEHTHADAPPVLVKEHPRFASQRLDEAGATRVAVVKSGCTILLDTIEQACPHNRHRSLAITALEEACMWAVKAISHEKVPL